MPETMTTYQVRLPKELLEEFQKYAKANDKSPAGEIREFMREYIEFGRERRRYPWRHALPF